MRSIAVVLLVGLLHLVVVEAFEERDYEVVDGGDECLAVEELHFKRVHLEHHN